MRPVPKPKPRKLKAKRKKKLVIHLEIVPLAKVIPLIDNTPGHGRKVKLETRHTANRRPTLTHRAG
jgi:hypothetical protein